MNPPPNAALAGMASETVYILQTWVAGRGGALAAGPQVGCRDAEAARRKAERLAPLRLGGGPVPADTEPGDDDGTPTIILKAGQLPEMFD